MKKLLTFFALSSFSAIFSQITINANFPLSMNTGSTVDAEVKINKGTVGNFAKYQLDVPTGYIISCTDPRTGNFTFENQRAKIVWVSVPSDPEFTIKFKVQVNSDAANPATFSQKFYYLENNEKKEVEASPIVITIGGAGAVASSSSETKPAETKPVEPVKETKPVEQVKETKTAEQPVKEAKPVSANTSTEKKTNEAATAKSSVSEAGMTFKVQIGAYSTEPTKGKFSGAGKVNIDLINGMYKVTTGSFKTREEAIKYRDELQSKGFNNCFIAKYKDGVRIN